MEGFCVFLRGVTIFGEQFRCLVDFGCCNGGGGGKGGCIGGEGHVVDWGEVSLANLRGRGT